MVVTFSDEETRRVFHIFKRELLNNKGKGFVEFDFTDMGPDMFIKGKASPKRVIVLSDMYCGSSGDSFVEICKKSPKVTVIGRATMGVNDYANLAKKKWDDGFVMMYPTSRLSRIDQGNGMTGVGILPHVHIPWTPAHLHEDIDLEHALRLLEIPSI